MDVLTVYISDGEKPQVEEYLNWKIFNEEFNFGFGYPHNDTCDQLKVAIDSAQSADEQCQLQTELAKHHKKLPNATVYIQTLLMLMVTPNSL